MQSLKELYKIGNGPSSSHTMGPKKAAEQFLIRAPKAESYRITLYGSLASTGKGHLTDIAIRAVLEPAAPVEILWRGDIVHEFHTNGMLFEALRGNEVFDSWLVYSVGGGSIASPDMPYEVKNDVYPMSHIEDILRWCDSEGKTFWEYVGECEDDDIWEYLDNIWTAMRRTLDN